MKILTSEEAALGAAYKVQLKEAQAKSLDWKIAHAIDLFRTYQGMALSVSFEGFYLAFSGGKDSIVLHRLAEEAGVAFAPWYNQTTIDPPELVRFIQAEYPHVGWNRPEQNLPLSIDRVDGPPTRRNRWCCSEYKEHGGDGQFKAIGVRAAESPRRASQWREIIANRNGGNILCPILYWTDTDVWDFIYDRKLKYCKLYDEGWKRLGCVGCPMSGRKGRLRDFARWPRFENLWKTGFRRYWNRWKGVPRRDGKPRWIEKFDRWEQLWSWWMEDPEPAEECVGNFNWSGGEESGEPGSYGDL